LKESIKNYENHVISLGKNKTAEEDCRWLKKNNLWSKQRVLREFIYLFFARIR